MSTSVNFIKYDIYAVKILIGCKHLKVTLFAYICIEKKNHILKMFNRFSGNINIIWVMVSQPIFFLQFENWQYYNYQMLIFIFIAYIRETLSICIIHGFKLDKVYNFSILCLSYLGSVIPSNQSKVSCGLLHQCISMCGIERKLVIMWPWTPV